MHVVRGRRLDPAERAQLVLHLVTEPYELARVIVLVAHALVFAVDQALTDFSRQNP